LLTDLIGTFPLTRAVFDRYGLRGCGGEFGPNEQAGWFARLHGVPLETLLSELNQAARQPQTVNVSDFSPSITDTIYRPFFSGGNRKGGN
jgi:hypothetical protein